MFPFSFVEEGGILLDEIWIAIIICTAILFFAICLSLIFAKAIRRRESKIKSDEEAILNGIETGIAAQLHAACPESKWRWVCRPLNWVTNGGIARIDVMDSSGKQRFMDVCYRVDGYMALHVIDAVELVTKEVAAHTKDADVLSMPILNPVVKPDDEESVATWFKIVLIGTLTELIGELHADGEASLHIGHDGKAYVETESGRKSVHEFGNLPDATLWDYIVDKLNDSGLYAEIQGNDSIFISWC